MFAVASAQRHDPAGQMLESSFGQPVPRRSVGAAIRHGLIVGAAATVLQVLLLLAVLYTCGIVAS
jgi:hypothetical protein